MVNEGGQNDEHEHDAARTEQREARKAERAAATKRPAKEPQPVIQNQAASTTLGDIDALAELKAKLEKGE